MPFSRNFKHRDHEDPYDILMDCPATGQYVCKTSFIQQRVVDYFELHSTANEFKVVEVVQSGENYFGLQAKANGQDLGAPLVGDYPCPDDCLPPSLLGTSFDRRHLGSVISLDNCRFLQIHRSTLSNVITYLNFSIYALVQEGSNLVAKDNYGDPIYTSL